MKLFDEPLSKANAHICFLEEKLHQSIADGDQTRKRLYETEALLHDASSSRTAFQRHLQLEQYESGLLRAKQDKLSSDMDAMLTYNEMLRQEIEHLQKIIESMATTLATQENEAQSLVESTAGQSHYTAQQWLDSGLWPPAPEQGSGSNAAGSSCLPSEQAAADGVGKNRPLKRLAASGGQERRGKKAKPKTPQIVSKV